MSCPVRPLTHHPNMTAAKDQAIDRAEAVAFATQVAKHFEWDDFWYHHDRLSPKLIDLVDNDGITQEKARELAMSYARENELMPLQSFSLAIWADAWVFGYYADPILQMSTAKDDDEYRKFVTGP